MEWLPAEIIGQDAGAWFRLLVVLAAFLLGFWKALPSVLDAFERRQSGIEVRTQALLDSQTERFEIQLTAADDRHAECMEGQRLLREALDALRRESSEEIRQLRAQNSELWSTLNAMRQGAMSVQNVVARTIQEAKDKG